MRLHLATVKFYMCPCTCFSIDHATLMYVETILMSLWWPWASTGNFQGKTTVSFVFDLQLCSVQSGGTMSRCLVQCLERSSYTTHLEDYEYVWGVSNFECYHWKLVLIVTSSNPQSGGPNNFSYVKSHYWYTWQTRNSSICNVIRNKNVEVALLCKLVSVYPQEQNPLENITSNK